jgi:hypothetical protein
VKAIPLKYYIILLWTKVFLTKRRIIKEIISRRTKNRNKTNMMIRINISSMRKKETRTIITTRRMRMKSSTERRIVMKCNRNPRNLTRVTNVVHIEVSTISSLRQESGSGLRR